MPGRKCIICGNSSLVTNKEGTNTSYFSFPRDENLRKKWIDVCHSKIDNIITARICSDHFKEEDFFHSKNGTEDVRKKRLKFNIVPSLYLDAKVVKQCRSIKSFITENSKDFLKKGDSSRDIETSKDQNTILQSKRKSTSGNKNNKIIREQIKRKSTSENNKNSNLLSKQKYSKGVNNKENTKDLTKTKTHLKNIPPGTKVMATKKKEKELIKNKKTNKILNDISVKKDMQRHKISKKSINKENQVEIVKEKLINRPSDAIKDKSKEQKLTKAVLTKSTKKEVKSEHKISSEEENKSLIENNSGIPKQLTKHVICVNDTEIISQDISQTKDALQSNSNNVDIINRKPTKRKGSMGNGVPRKVVKKRIRLGKDDSEDSEDSYSEHKSTNNVNRDRITYKSPSEMAQNKDLLKYLNYLKEKSESSDQPILFWVDD